MNRFRVLPVCLTLILVAITPTVFGCEAEGENVTVTNQSREVVVVYEDDVPIDLLQPRVSEEFHVLRFSGTLQYSVRSFESRDVLAERAFTWDEIVENDGFTLVIE